MKDVTINGQIKPIWAYILETFKALLYIIVPELNTYAQQKVTEGFAPQTIVRHFTVLKQALTLAQLRGIQVPFIHPCVA